MPLRYLFVDMNSYFASVEQELRPELRGKPIAVAPVMSANGTCIAVSYEAKKFGVRTGTLVADAKVLCPDIQFVEARPRSYVEMHHRIVDAVESCSHVDAVLSIDEMVTSLCPSEQNEEKATALAFKVKRAIYERVGKTMRCSIGIASNRFLAKVAADFNKPDGLTIFHDHDLKEKLSTLMLRDLPGIGKHMEIRMQRAGIYTVQQLLECTEGELESTWRSIIGRRWWHLLRGEDLELPESHRSTLGNSHVLPPELRSEEGAYAVLLRLIHKSSARLRKAGYFAKAISCSIKYLSGERWHESLGVAPCQDVLTILEHFFVMWKRKNMGGRPLKVSFTLSNLTLATSVTLPLFPAAEHRVQLGHTVDRLNSKFGTNMVYVAAMHQARRAAEPRIAFGVIPDIDDSSVA